MSDHKPECFSNKLSGDSRHCICPELRACEKRVLRDVVAAIEAEQRSFPDDPYVRRVGLGIAKAAVNKLMREQL